MPELITIAEYARRCQISVAGAWQRIKRNKLDAYITELNGLKFIDFEAVPHGENVRITAAGNAVSNTVETVSNTVAKKELTKCNDVVNSVTEENTRLKQQIELLHTRLDAEEKARQRAEEQLDKMQEQLAMSQKLHAATQTQLYRLLPQPDPEPAPEAHEEEEQERDVQKKHWWKRR